MTAVWLDGPHRLRIGPAPDEQPGDGEQLVRLVATGLCGTDLHGYRGDNPFLSFPRIPGHELVGEVISPGAVPVGSLVAVDPRRTCGVCRACRVGRSNACVSMRVIGVHVDGGFRQTFTAPSDSLHRLPAGLSPEIGALVEPLSIGANACLRAELAFGETVLVQGAGAIGLCCQLVAQALGAEVIVVDRLAERLALARRLGARATIDLTREDDGARLAELTDGDGPDAVIEATGSVAALRRAVDLVAPAGIVVTLTISRDRLELPVTEILVKKELDLRGSRLNRNLFPEVITLLANGLDPAPLISHRFALRDAAAAYELAEARPDAVLKALLLP